MIRLCTTFFYVGLLAAHATGQARPRLAVLCSVDQLAAWVHALGRPFYAEDGGFRRLEREGVTFANCAYQHACTETGPGHATIGTGAPAAVHGIAKNNWWSREEQRAVYCVGASAEALPDLPEGKDRSQAWLRVPTLADAVKAHIPGSKVASVSWKDRSAILMAGGGADVAAWIEKSTGNVVTNKTWVHETPAWMTAFNAARAIDQWFERPWARTGPAAAYEGLTDDRPYELVHANGLRGHTLPQPMTGGLLKPGPAYYSQLYASPFGNTMVRLAAEAAVRGMQLGQDDVPDLLCVSFSSTDVLGHVFGPDSVEARDALLRLDRELGTMFAMFDEVVGAGRWAVFLTADHGVGPTPEQARAGGVAAGRGPLNTWVKSAVTAALSRLLGPAEEGVAYVERVGENSVFLNQAAIAGRRDDAIAAATEAAGRARGVMAAYASDELRGDFAHPDPIRRALAYGLVAGRAGDVQFVNRPYWLNGATPASHGSPHGYDREVIGFARGPSVPRGATLATPITPGFGVALFAKMLRIPRPSGAAEVVPAGLLGLR
ncbi:MAG: alkaline phosphatase family protein [Planctomycetota bacterium]|nr:alkaline phosphatase family protein [Planctomycetota bacterium]